MSRDVRFGREQYHGHAEPKPAQRHDEFGTSPVGQGHFADHAGRLCHPGRHVQ
jgi:hypothetical protein